ncbi:hypothetical protein JCM3765_001100 [Sporobolomyces pararoseus]
MTLSQEKVGKLLGQSKGPEETEEVLLAYCFSKWMNGGNQAQVMRKLHLLTLYLRFELGHILRQHYQAFAIVASLTKSNTGPVVLLPVTPLGLEAWNAARRPSKSVLKRVFEGRGYSRSRDPSLPGSSESSDADENPEDDSATITPASRNRSGSGGLGSLMGGRRSRSNTTTATPAVVVNLAGERGEQTRRLAGAGASDGLGRGLLSSPPDYDSNLTSYLASSTTSSESSLILSHHDDSSPPLVLRDEVEALPGYA